MPFLAYFWSVATLSSSPISHCFETDQEDRSVKPLAVLDQSQIFWEAETGFRQVLDIMIIPVATMCISNGAQKKAVYVLNSQMKLKVSAKNEVMPHPMSMKYF
jgi:hypothetical protein